MVARASVGAGAASVGTKQIVVSVLARPPDGCCPFELARVNGSRNWVFLGDSLTEGVGSKRISHVSELAKQLRASEFRLRPIDSRNGNVDFNVAGLMSVATPELWLWNLACEGKTIESDFEWLPLIG